MRRCATVPALTSVTDSRGKQSLCHRHHLPQVSKEIFEGRHTYFDDVAMQYLCKDLAAQFNARGPPKRIDFLDAWIIEFPNRRAPNGMGSLVAMVEPYMRGVTECPEQHGLWQGHFVSRSQGTCWFYLSLNQVIIPSTPITMASSRPKTATRPQRSATLLGVPLEARCWSVIFKALVTCTPILRFTPTQGMPVARLAFAFGNPYN